MSSRSSTHHAAILLMAQFPRRVIIFAQSGSSGLAFNVALPPGYLLQEDGVSRIILEDGSGLLQLEN